MAQSIATIGASRDKKPPLLRAASFQDFLRGSPASWLCLHPRLHAWCGRLEAILELNALPAAAWQPITLLSRAQVHDGIVRGLAHHRALGRLRIQYDLCEAGVGVATNALTLFPSTAAYVPPQIPIASAPLPETLLFATVVPRVLYALIPP